MFRLSSVTAILMMVSGSALASTGPVSTDNAEFSQRLLKKAKFVPNTAAVTEDALEVDGAAVEKGQSSRRLENQYTAWMSKYSLKFDGCYSIPQFEREEGIRSSLVAKFKLCNSAESCSSCRDHGEYIVEMRDFIETYQEAQQEANEYECESKMQECEYQCQNGGQYSYQNGNDNNANGNGNYNYNNNNNNNNNGGDNEEYCQYMCLMDADMGYCNQDQGGQDMNFEEMAECRPIYDRDGGGNNNYYNYGGGNGYEMYYVGAYCNSNGVFVGAFKDSMCSNPAPSGTFEKYMGYSLPQNSLVGTDCISCAANDYNNGNNNNNNNNGNNNNNYYNNNYYGGVNEACEKIYEDAGKCEKNLQGSSYKNNGGCELMHNTLARLDRTFHGSSGAGFGSAKVWAWVLFATVVGLVGYVFVLQRKIQGKADISIPSFFAYRGGVVS